MPTPPFTRNIEERLIQLLERGDIMFDVLSSLNDKIDKENYKVLMDVDMKERKTKMDIVFFINAPVSYLKVRNVIRAMRPLSWSICSHLVNNIGSSNEKKLKLTLNMAYV